MDQRAIECFDEAMTDIDLHGDDPLRRVLHGDFVWATTTTMTQFEDSAGDVPEGLRIPRWSWNGVVIDGSV